MVFIVMLRMDTPRHRSEHVGQMLARQTDVSLTYLGRFDASSISVCCHMEKVPLV